MADPVSYTHLDVYKRQAIFCMNDLMAGGCYDWADESGIKIPPVSYTHLDVYKRQGADSVSR